MNILFFFFIHIINIINGDGDDDDDDDGDDNVCCSDTCKHDEVSKTRQNGEVVATVEEDDL